MSSRNIIGGAIVAGTGATFSSMSWFTLPIGTPDAMRAGFFPLALGIILTLLGIGIGLVKDNDDEEPDAAPIPWRGVFLSMGGVLFFALALKPLGLVIALLAGLGLVSFASPQARWHEAALLSIGLTLFCAFVFVKGLGMPANLLGYWFKG